MILSISTLEIKEAFVVRREGIESGKLGIYIRACSYQYRSRYMGMATWIRDLSMVDRVMIGFCIELNL